MHFRIYRDTRFSNDKRPYKTHVAAWWVHEGLKDLGRRLLLHVAANEVIIAAGAYMPEKEQLAQIRHWLLDHHEEFRKLLKRPAVSGRLRSSRAMLSHGRPRASVRAPGDGSHPLSQWGLSCTLPRKQRSKKIWPRHHTLLTHRRAHCRRAEYAHCGGRTAKRKVLFGLR